MRGDSNEAANADGSGTKAKTTKDDLVSCYGVVLSYTAPKALAKGKASRYMQSYFLADPSMPYAVTTNVCLNVFAERYVLYMCVCTCMCVCVCIFVCVCLGHSN